MQSLFVFSCAIAATLAVTPFFESPDNEHAAAFYKKPASNYAPAAPVYNPAPVYKPVPAPVYKPAPAPVYKPAPAPVYKPAPAPAYQPAYKAPEYKSDYGHGATSYQKVNLEVGEPSYKPQY